MTVELFCSNLGSSPWALGSWKERLGERSYLIYQDRAKNVFLWNMSLQATLNKRSICSRLQITCTGKIIVRCVVASDVSRYSLHPLLCVWSRIQPRK